jgi:hypothetical protein
VCDVVGEQAKVVHADLVILGTHGRRGVRRLFLGSDAEQILRTSSIPVLMCAARPPKSKPVRPDLQSCARSLICLGPAGPNARSIASAHPRRDDLDVPPNPRSGRRQRDGDVRSRRGDPHGLLTGARSACCTS